MQDVSSSETLVYIYQITRCHILNDGVRHYSIFKVSKGYTECKFFSLVLRRDLGRCSSEERGSLHKLTYLSTSWVPVHAIAAPVH